MTERDRTYTARPSSPAGLYTLQFIMTRPCGDCTRTLPAGAARRSCGCIFDLSGSTVDNLSAVASNTGSFSSETTKRDLTPVKFFLCRDEEVTDLLMHEVVTLPPLRERSILMTVSVCPSVCLSVRIISVNHTSRLHQIFTDGRSSIVIGWRCDVMYFRFCG